MAATQAGFAAVYALPLRFQGETVGALSLFGPTAGLPSEEDRLIAQALTDVAAVGLVQRRDLHSQATLVGQLQTALSTRIVIEQAKGVVAEHLGVPVDVAFTALRRYARSRNRLLAEVAAEVVAGTIDFSGSAHPAV